MPQMPDDLRSYLTTLISPPKEYPGEVVYLSSLDGVDFSQWADNTLNGMIAHGTPTSEQAAEIMRALKPGAHFLLVAPDEQPTGHTGACTIEDAGFEIRDAILWVREPGRLHYVPKASRSEREVGCEKLPGRTAAEATDSEEGQARLNSPRTGAGRTADMVRNFHPCLHPDALVMTDQGYRQIQFLHEGDWVYTADGTFHKVVGTTRHPYMSECLYRLFVQGTNFTTLATDNHPFLIWRPKRKGKRLMGGEVLWLPADQIAKGDYTMTPVSKPGVGSPLVSDDPEFWFLFGLWLAEGVIQSSGHGGTNGYPSYTLGKDEVELVERIRRYFGADKVSVYPKKEGAAVQVMAFNPIAGFDFERLGGRGAANKSLHQDVWLLKTPCQKALFDGYMAGDGGKVRTWLQAKTVSSALATQMCILGESLGYKANLFWFEAKPGKIGDRQFKTTLPHYQMQFYERDVNQTKRKSARPARLEHEGVMFSRRYVQAIEKVPYQGDVVNLSIEGSPTFQTAVGVSHNTVKPIGIMQRLLEKLPVEEGSIMDPFMGSGSTGIACLRTGHSFIGIERDPDYLAIADARIRYHNGNSPRDPAVVESDAPPQPETEGIDMDAFFGF